MSIPSNMRGSTPQSVIPSFWDTTGNGYTSVSAANPLPTAQGAPVNLTALTTAQVTATTTSGATAFVPALSTRRTLFICNSSTTQGVFVGVTGVTAANGHYLVPGGAMSLEGGAACLAHFVITAANTAVCSYAGYA